MTQNATANTTSAAGMYTTATVVPAVTSVAQLGGYATIDAFNTSERTRVWLMCTGKFVQQPFQQCR